MGNRYIGGVSKFVILESTSRGVGEEEDFCKVSSFSAAKDSSVLKLSNFVSF